MIYALNPRILMVMTAQKKEQKKEYRSYISKRIRKIYRRSLIAPIVFLCLILLFAYFFDIKSFVFPAPLRPEAPEEYSIASFQDLRFTGYTESILGRTNGYYYYTVVGKELTMVLLSPETAGGGVPLLDSLSVRCRRIPRGELQQEIAARIAQDLNLSADSSTIRFSRYYFDEPDYHYAAGVFLFLLMLLCSIYAAYEIVHSLIILRFPHFAPSIRVLKRFGNPKRMLKKAEEELLTLPQLATEDLFITEHFFIEVSNSEVAVVPIREIIWVYKHSTLHKFLWYHFSISYTLSITANRHIYIHCPKNLKSDIDGIIDYLAEANHSILVGFSEENRLRVQEIQGTPMQLDKLLAFLNRRL